MKVRRLTNDGDWSFGLGLANYARDNEAILQNVSTRIKSFKGDWFLDVEAGIDWFNLLGSKDTKELITKEIERVVLETEGVVRINKIEIIDIKDRKATIIVEFDTIFSVENELKVEL